MIIPFHNQEDIFILQDDIVGLFYALGGLEVSFLTGAVIAFLMAGVVAAMVNEVGAEKTVKGI